MTEKQLDQAIDTAAAVSGGKLREALHSLFRNTAVAMQSFKIADATRDSVPVTVRAYIVCIPKDQAAGFEAMINAAVTTAAPPAPEIAQEEEQKIK